MMLDGRSLQDGAALAADLCIVGAGPAGITLARELIGSSVTVVLLECGGLGRNDTYQALNDGAVIGDAYARLSDTRHRRAGGTTHLWNTQVGTAQGAKYVPLDPWDFEPRPDVAHSGWPLSHTEVEPFYARAQRVCGLGRFAYDGNAWVADRAQLLSLGAPFSTKVYQFGSGELFTRRYLREIGASATVTLLHDMTACGLETGARPTQVAAVVATSLSRRRVRIHAERFVLAAGAIENARLLLLSADNGRAAFGSAGGWLGRCLMEHPRDRALTLVPRSPAFGASVSFYDAHPGPDATIVSGRFGLDGETLRQHGLPNASITLMPDTYASLSRARRLFDRGRSLFGLPGAPSGYGWSQRPGRSPDRFRLLVNAEQFPERENRLVLSTVRDVLGMPRVEMHWRLGHHSRAALHRLRTFIAAEVRAADVGTVLADPRARPDPNAHHHAGTTRMHPDACDGVVDADLLVHGMDNLYVAGSSVFPTAGFANPTLTIVALSLRLADHLSQKGATAKPDRPPPGADR